MAIDVRTEIDEKGNKQKSSLDWYKTKWAEWQWAMELVCFDQRESEESGFAESKLEYVIGLQTVKWLQTA